MAEGGLRIRVKAQPAVAAEASSAPRQAGAREAGAGPGELRGRVRAAMRCPYCREDVAAETAAAEAAPLTGGRLDTALLLLLATMAGLAAFVEQGAAESALFRSVALGCLVHLVVVRPALRFAGTVAHEVRRLRAEEAGGEGTGTVACARAGCGALYHAECWHECRTSYGACAVFGCGSTEVERVSAVTLLVRVLRMFVAAFVFSPQVVDALREGEAAGVTSIRDAIRERAAGAHRSMWSKHADEGSRLSLSLLQIGTVLGALVFSIREFYLSHLGRHPHPTRGLLVLFAVPLAAVLLLYGGSWVTALLIYAAKAVLAGELAALSRLGQGGSFLSRLKLSGGGKKR